MKSIAIFFLITIALFEFIPTAASDFTLEDKDKIGRLLAKTMRELSTIMTHATHHYTRLLDCVSATDLRKAGISKKTFDRFDALIRAYNKA